MKTFQLDRSFLVVILGVAYEHFDMMLVSLLASSIIGEFVSASSSSQKLLYGYIGYAIAFLFRPLGAFVFGCIGDLYGRKTSLISSMALMSAATLALGFIPGVELLGLGSTGLFLLCRIAQGFAVGGEYGTAMTFAYEIDPNRRTFYGACVVSSTHIGGMLASVLASIYIENFRIVFLIGGAMGFSILLLRSFIKEKFVVQSKRMSEIASHSIQNKKAVIEALIVASMTVFVFYGSLIYLNEVVFNSLNISRSEIFRANSFLLGFWILFPPFCGYFVDKFSFSYRKLMKFAACGVFLTAPFLGLALSFSYYPAVLAMQFTMHFFHALFSLCTPRFFGDLFAHSSRNTAVSTTYSLSASLTAASAPMICHASLSLFQVNFAICLPFMLIALTSFMILNKERAYAKG